jgi:hypothetical protein
VICSENSIRFSSFGVDGVHVNSVCSEVIFDLVFLNDLCVLCGESQLSRGK